jgi:hypothetical protein
MALAKSLKQGLGNWVDGDLFFDREKELEVFSNYLRQRVNLLLVAPRRIGKTSFMRQASRVLADEIIGLYVDVEKSASPEEAIVELGLACKPFKSLWTKAVGAFGELLTKLESVKVSELSITLRSSLNADNWRQKGDELIAVLAAAADQAGKPTVLFFDEVPILVNRILRGPEGTRSETPASTDRRLIADMFMSWMRDNAARHKGKVVFVVTGSIGLEPVLRRAGLSGTINALHPFELKPWRDEIAVACLLALAADAEFPLPEPQAAHMVARLGCAIPHHIQLFFDHLRSAYILDDESGDVTSAFIDTVYDSKMTGLHGHADLMHMEERLKLVLDDKLFELALTLLTETAVVGSLAEDASAAITKRLRAERSDLLETLSILQHDGYLRWIDDKKAFVFVSHLVRDWWKNRFGYGYKPAK